MQTAEQIAKLEKRQTELSQELDRFLAEQARMLKERQALSFGALVEGDKAAEKAMEGISGKLAEIANRIGERQEALVVLEGKLAELREVLRQEKLAEAAKACIGALIAGYKLRIEIEELNLLAETKWRQIDELHSVASQHRVAVLKLGGRKEDFFIPSNFREIKDGESTLMLKKLEAGLGK